MFGSLRIASRKSDGCRFAALVIAASATAFLGACAHNPGDMPALQWQVNTVEATGAEAQAYGAAEASSTTGCGDARYVYRGGRDPHTGLAYTQL